MRESPRTRRLRTDLRALENLRQQSSILDFSATRSTPQSPPEQYQIRFRGRGIWRPDGTHDIHLRELHEIHIQLGASYPRMMPEMSWKTPIFHPNISGSGVVCLGGYGTHWVPSLNLDELCTMLWDMIRYYNFDTESPYNREAAAWAKSQSTYRLPVDSRPIRDLVAQGLVSSDGPAAGKPAANARPPIVRQPVDAAAQPARGSDTGVMFINDNDIVDAEIVEPEDPDILFID